MNCLFCCDVDTDDKPEAGKDLICFLCVQMLLAAHQEDLNRAYSEAIKRWKTRGASAIISFLIEGELTNEPKAKKPERSIVRKKPMRVVRPTRD